MPNNLFLARWRGYCGWCSEEWIPGDYIAYVEGAGERDDLICGECWEKIQLEEEWGRFDAND